MATYYLFYIVVISIINIIIIIIIIILIINELIIFSITIFLKVMLLCSIYELWVVT